MYCHNCGNPFEQHHKYCTNCGQPLISTSQLIVPDNSLPIHDDTPVDSNNISFNLDRLHSAIKSCMYNSNDNARDLLVELLESIVMSRDLGIKLVQQFYNSYQINLIFQLSEISTAFMEQKRYLKKFIEFEIIEKDYPYAFKEESLVVLEPIQENFIAKPRRKFSPRAVILFIGILFIAYYIFTPKSGLLEDLVNKKTSTFNKNESISVGNFVFFVTGYELYKKSNEEKYLKVHLLVTNQSNEARYVVASLFRLIDEEGKIYEYSIDEGTNINLRGENELFLMQINPNIRKSGFIVFEIPKRKRYFLELSGGIGNNNTERVLIE